MNQQISKPFVETVVNKPVESDATPPVELSAAQIARMARIRSASNRTERERRRAALR
ncbi:hypothetical protein VDG1235_4857 [Verrucomicrobiia bacterium DG1235]|nr:hypothetical protein VDG1235_4857 [Verrucomicrobiae bacterium DG1235]